MINTQLLELPMPGKHLHGPKDVRVIKVRLYVIHAMFRFVFLSKDLYK